MRGRIVKVALLVDVATDAEASDFCSETFGDMPFVIDWTRLDVPSDPATEEYSATYLQTDEYVEGDFLSAVKS